MIEYRPAQKAHAAFQGKILVPINRFTVRFHLSLILLATLAAGWVSSHLLLKMGISSISFRYGLAAFGSYGVFLLVSRLWLAQMAERGRVIEQRLKKVRRSTRYNVDKDLTADDVELAEVALDIGGDVAIGAFESWSGPSAISDISSGGTDWLNFSFDADDIVGLIFGATLFLVAIALLGWGTYVLLELPLLFFEGIFYGILTAALAKTARRFDDPDWTGSLIRDTWGVFVILILCAVLFGFFAKRHCPEALTFKQSVFCSSLQDK